MFNTLSSRLMQIFSPARILELAKESSWYKRRGKICPFEFLFSSVGQASALELTLNAQVATFTEPVSRQAVDQRYNPQAVEFFGAAFKDILTKTLAWKTDSPMSQSLQRASELCAFSIAPIALVQTLWLHCSPATRVPAARLESRSS
jgi:hypothetical protein